MVRTVDQTRKPQIQTPPETLRKPQQSVAVIGLGMSGCVAAHFLSKKYNVTCFEIASVPGLYAHSVNDLPGAVSRLDMPLRAVSPHYYRNLYELYNYLGIELEQTNYQHTVVDLDTKEKLFSYLNICCFGLAIPLPYITLSRFASAFLILLGLLQLVLLTPWVLFWNRTAITQLSLKEYLNSYGYNADFQQLFFYPILSTLLSCSYKQVQEYPAVLIAEFMCANATTLFTGWYRVRGAGVYGVASTLLSGLDPSQCHFNTRVSSVATKKTSVGKTKVEVVAEHNFSWASSSSGAGTSSSATPSSPNKLFPGAKNSSFGSGNDPTSSSTDNVRTYTFDHVVVAVEPDVARRIVVTDTQELINSAEGRCMTDFLNSTKFFTADIIAHRDASFMMMKKSGNNNNSNGNSNNATSNNLSDEDVKSNTSSSSSGGDVDDNNKKNLSFGSSSSATKPSPTSRFSVTKTTSTFSNNNSNNTIVQQSYETISNILQGAFPYVDTPATGLTVFGTGQDAACARATQSPAPRNASTTTANVTLLWKVGQDGNGNNNSNNNDEKNPNLLFETWNPIGLPKNIVKRARMTRAVWDVEGFLFAENFAKHAQGFGNIWFAGSYCSRGVTLLEQACTSALDVAIDFDCEIPFKVNNPSQKPMNASWWIVILSLYLTIIDFCIRKFFSVVNFFLNFVSTMLRGKKNGMKKQTSTASSSSSAVPAPASALPSEQQKEVVKNSSFGSNSSNKKND